MKSRKIKKDLNTIFGAVAFGFTFGVGFSLANAGVQSIFSLIELLWR